MMKAAEDRSRTHKHQAEFGLARQTNIWHFPTSEDLGFHLLARRVVFKISLVSCGSFFVHCVSLFLSSLHLCLPCLLDELIVL